MPVKTKTVFRILKYELPDDSTRDTWLAHTLKMSIDGRYELPNGCSITGTTVAEGVTVDQLLATLRVADIRPWFPPHMESRQKSRGDV